MENNAEASRESNPLSFAALGVPVYSRVHSSPITGQVRTIASIKRHEWVYFLVCFASLLSSLILTIERMSSSDFDKMSDDFTFAILLIYTTVFCAWYIIHGIMKERPFEILVFVAGTCTVMMYSILNFVYEERTLRKKVRLAFVLSLGPFLIIGGVWLSKKYFETNDFIIRTLGSTWEMLSIGRTLFFFTSLLKFDLQLGGSIIILIMTNGANVDTTQTILLTVGAITFLVWTILGYLSIRFESKVLVGIFLATSLLSPALIAYKFNMLYKENSPILKACLIACGVVGLLVRALAVLFMVLVMRNFGKGIKEKLYGRCKNDTLTDSAHGECRGSVKQQSILWTHLAPTLVCFLIIIPILPMTTLLPACEMGVPDDLNRKKYSSRDEYINPLRYRPHGR